MSRLLFAALLLFATSAFAADMDPRVPPRQIDALSSMIGQLTANATRLAAVLDVEMADHAKDRQQLTDLQKWVQEYFGK